MTSEWRSLHVYTPAIDPLVIDVIDPFFAAHGDDLDCGFWERRLAGGPHVRVRMRAERTRLDAIALELRTRLEGWLALHPALARTDYSPARVRRLLEMEGVDPASEDLAHRHGVVTEGTYPEMGKTYASPAARQLAEDFKCARGPLAAAILRAAEPRDELTLRLYCGLALFAGRGRYSAGSVSFKSHWEHFALTLPEAAIDRFTRSYEQHRPRLFVLMDDVQHAWHTAARAVEAPLLDRWWRLLATIDEQAAAVLRRGQPISMPPSGVDPRAGPHERSGVRAAHRRSEFVETLWAYDGVEMALYHDRPFQRRRALVNLLYELVAALAFTPIDRQTFCHHIFRAVEDREGCDLTAVMRHNIPRVLQRSRDALPRDAGAGAPATAKPTDSGSGA